MCIYETIINNPLSPATSVCCHCIVGSSFFRNSLNVCHRLLRCNIQLPADKEILIAAHLVLMLLKLPEPLILGQFIHILGLKFLNLLSSLVILKHLRLLLRFLEVYACEHISFRYPCCAFLNDVELAELHHFHCLE